MTWVKQNYDRFLLALLAAVLAVCAVLLFLQVRGFNSVFASLRSPVHHNDEIPIGTNKDKVEDEEKHLAAPDQWGTRKLGDRRLPVFVSVPYIEKTEVGPDGTATRTLVDPYVDDPKFVLHPPIPNQWLIANKLDLLDSNVLDQDPDKDGFSNLDEYLGKTDPNEKGSHPPYWTKLFLKRFVRIPFVLRFEARNGEKFFVNTVGSDDPTQVVKIGDTVRFKNTRFKITKYEDKHRQEDGINRDVSELTLTNPENGQTVVLPKEQDVDSPTTYAVFTYLWVGPGTRPEFAVLRGGEFTLKPEDNVKYKVLEMSDTEIRVLKEDDNKELHVRMRTQGG